MIRLICIFSAANKFPGALPTRLQPQTEDRCAADPFSMIILLLQACHDLTTKASTPYSL